MSDLNTNENWQVEVNGQVYQADLSELAEWIADGALQPEDKVRRGNLRWIEAKKVPKLTEFFNAKANGLPPPAIVVSTTDGGSRTGVSEVPCTVLEPVQNVAFDADSIRPEPEKQLRVANDFAEQPARDPAFCINHNDRAASLVCLSCARSFCRECVKSFGSSVMICSACGGMCKSKADLGATHAKDEFKTRSIEQGFGFGDLLEALRYPLRFKSSLIFGSLMYAFFSLGKMATSFGGIYMIVGSIFSYMLANMLAFGILANTIDSFAHGKIGGNFMPDFEDFSLWDDVIHPFLLSIGVYISAFGPFILVFLIGSYLVMSSVSSQMNTMKTNLEQTPGTPYYNVRDTVDQSEDVKGVLSNTERINQQHLDAQESIENGQPSVTVDQSEENVQRVNKMIADSKRQELESVVGKSPETRERESAAFIAALLKLAAPIMVIGFITFLWGLFYFPAACTVAGYTRSFVATVNPLVGLDTIKRLRFDYVKILFMALFLVVAFAIASMIFSFIFMAFDMPGVGNVPAKAFESLVWFYLVIVFACLLGFAMFKASDRLKLSN